MRGTNAEQKQITRECLLTALIELWETTPYESITVSELTRRAGVSRMAFYRNYASLDQIVEDHMRGLYEAHVEGLVRDGRAELEDYGVRFFRYIADNQRFMRKALRAGFSQVLLECIEDYIGSEDALRIRDADLSRFADAHLRRFVAGGLLVTVGRWLEDGMRETPEELGKVTSGYVRQLLGPAPAGA